MKNVDQFWAVGKKWRKKKEFAWGFCGEKRGRRNEIKQSQTGLKCYVGQLSALQARAKERERE